MKNPKKGMWNCKFIKTIAGAKIGKEVIYHASTANTLEKKGIVEIIDRVQKYIPKTMKE